jgi:hypothetical protein
MDRELAAFVSVWRIAGPELEAMRDRALLATPLPEALDQLSDMIESALFLHPPVPSSGVEQMQAVSARLRR